MRKFLFLDKHTLVATGIFIIFFIWWIVLNASGVKSTQSNYLFGAIYGPVMSLYGGIVGLLSAKMWGGYKSVMGKAIYLLSAGLFFQAFGQIVFSYYGIFAGVEVPYPSIADIGFFGYIPLYCYGIVLLARVSGIKISLQSFTSQVQAIAIPTVMLILSYFFFLKSYEFDWTQPLNIFLDFGYPLGQAFNVSLAILTYSLCRKTLGGIMRKRIFLLIVAYIAQYLADYIFLFQNSRGEYYVGGIVDLLYLIAYTFMALGLFQLRSTALNLQKK